jgi:hypothetical protein
MGAANISVADDNTKQVSVYDNGQLVRTMPTSMGMGGTEIVAGKPVSFWTQRRVYSVTDKASPVVFDASTYGLPINSAWAARRRSTTRPGSAPTASTYTNWTPRCGRRATPTSPTAVSTSTRRMPSGFASSRCQATSSRWSTPAASGDSCGRTERAVGAMAAGQRAGLTAGPAAALPVAHWWAVGSSGVSIPGQLSSRKRTAGPEAQPLSGCGRRVI